MTEIRLRLADCVEAWPECHEGGYDPRCCRFPKSCSCTVYDDGMVRDDELEDPQNGSPATPGEQQ